MTIQGNVWLLLGYIYMAIDLAGIKIRKGIFFALVQSGPKSSPIPDGMALKVFEIDL